MKRTNANKQIHHGRSLSGVLVDSPLSRQCYFEFPSAIVLLNTIGTLSIDNRELKNHDEIHDDDVY